MKILKKQLLFMKFTSVKRGVTEKLKKSLGDFFFSYSFEDVKLVPKLLEYYVEGKTEVAALMQQDLRAFFYSSSR